MEGLQSPSFQRVLCSNAVEAALALGLHLESDRLTELSSDESLKRAWLWWALYSLEKHLSFTSGRPSTIDDRVTSDRIPSRAPASSNLDLECFITAIRHAKLSSRISRELLSARATKASLDEVSQTVKTLHKELKCLLDDIPSSFQIGTLTNPSDEAHLIPRRIHALYLHFTINGSIMAVHSQFFYPWICSRFSDENFDATTDSQVLHSSTAVAEAARKILLSLRTVTTNVVTPTWLAFSSPIYAHLNLFIFVLKHPALSTTSADLGLLDICAGHFGYIDFMTTSEIAVSLPRESVNLATQVIKSARRKKQKDLAASIEQYSITQGVEKRHGSLEDNSPSLTNMDSSRIRFHEVSTTLLSTYKSLAKDE